MRTKHVGVFLAGIAIALFFVTVSFTETLVEANKILHKSCTLPQGICPYTGFPLQSAAAFLIDIIIFASGTFLILNSKKDEKISAENRKTFETTLKSLAGDEKKLYEIITGEGAIFQSDLVEKSGFPKAKVTRILDKMEGKSLVERRRRGLTNMIVPKKPLQA
ncbi:MAG: MarR family transcriptional regulator [Candidatus Aenigmarchaeota archaeon]|nr:MarR family transcriptional regulator [Candidatus Aenigmarchaeota archaeon]